MSNFVTMTQEEFEKSLPDGWRIIDDPRSMELIYEIATPNPNLTVRIYSSVDVRTRLTRDVGKDAIRCIYYDALNKRPLGKGRRIYRVEGKTSIEERIAQRIQEFVDKFRDVKIVDFQYILAILNSPTLVKNNFAMSLRDSAMKYGRLSEKQISYILGDISPSGYETFEKKVKKSDPSFMESYLNSLEEDHEESLDMPVEDSNLPVLDTLAVKLDETVLIPTEGYKWWKYPFPEFNYVQSAVWPYKANDKNLIVSANTSSGKTIAAELLIDECFDSNDARKTVVYTSPMKSLATERLNDWKERYPDKTIVMLTGDSLFNQNVRKAEMAKAAEADIIITTFELLDSITRHFSAEKYYFLQNVKLIIMDESHCLTMENRGDIAESALLRLTKINPHARICFLSATMNNVKELAEWLTVLNSKETDIVLCTWRPVPLQMQYLEHYVGRYAETQVSKENICVELAMSKPEEKFMIFVHSKTQGRSIINRLSNKGETAVFHNADLDFTERQEIEKSFKQRSGGLRVLVSTSTTAIGVNLPARNVIICGVNRGLSEVDEMEIVQELGRAGRPQFDDAAFGFMVAPSGSVPIWQQKISNPRPVTSVMNNRSVLAFHVLSEIYTRDIKTEVDLLNWYKRTLAYKQNVEFTMDDAKNLLEILEEMEMISRK